MKVTWSCVVNCVMIICYDVPSNIYFFRSSLKGRVMGPPLALVCLCFRRSVIVAFKIVSVSCSLDNFLLKNLIVFIFGKQLLKWCTYEKNGLYTFFSHQGKTWQKFLYIYTHILLTLLTFSALSILQKLRIYHMVFLVRLLVLILIPCWSNQLIRKWRAKFNNKTESKNATNVYLH